MRFSVKCNCLVFSLDEIISAGGHNCSSQFESQGGQLFYSLNSATNQVDVNTLVKTFQAVHHGVCKLARLTIRLQQMQNQFTRVALAPVFRRHQTTMIYDASFHRKRIFEFRIMSY